MAKKTLGAESYRKGALERLLDAELLLDAEQFAGSVYLSGRGVECMLRAIIWRHDSEIKGGRQVLETGHDLRELLTRVRSLGLLASETRDERFIAAIQNVGRLWHNNRRYFSKKAVESFWRELGIVNKRRTLKLATKEFFESCFMIIKRGDALCD